MPNWLNCQLGRLIWQSAMSAKSSLSNGRTVIPAALREQLGMRDGDQLLWELRDGELVVTTRAAKLRRAQALFRKYVPADAPSVADELIAERRAESTDD